MNILGIKPALGDKTDLDFWCYHNGGAALLKDGKISGIVEEERFTREKRAEHKFPAQSIQSVLEREDMSIKDVDIVAVGRDPKKIIRRASDRPTEFIPTYPSDWSSVKNMGTAIASAAGLYRKSLVRHLEEATEEKFNGRYMFIPHHRCHMATASYCSNFENQLTLTIDGTGEYDSTVVWRDGERLQTFSRYNSLGGFYGIGSSYLGFRGVRDAGKVMGLAAYGEENEAIRNKFEQLIDVKNDNYRLKVEISDKGIEKLEDLFGPSRNHNEPIKKYHKDFAYRLQKTLERAVENIAEHYLKKTGAKNISLAGGVAMNCKANKRLKDLELVENIFIQPGADDRGICLGAALEAYKQATGDTPTRCLEHVYYGTSYTSDTVEETLKKNKLSYKVEENIEEKAAELLSDGKTVGWFQGRMEYGARALGNRSILANPTDQKYRDKVNRDVKGREEWRPFAPSILQDKKEEYLQTDIDSPFMIMTDSVTEKAIEDIPATVHTDRTTRPQTVEKNVNPKFYRLIKHFESKTGVPVILNTSFNLSGKPIVESPQDAINTYYNSGLDALCLEDFLLVKDTEFN